MKGITAVAILVLSLLDDVVLLGVSQAGLHISWLHRFVPLIWVVMIMSLIIHFFPRKYWSNNSTAN